LTLTLQDLANIFPALNIAVETHGTPKSDKRIWLDLMDKIETIIQESQKEKTPNEV